MKSETKKNLKNKINWLHNFYIIPISSPHQAIHHTYALNVF